MERSFALTAIVMMSLIALSLPLGAQEPKAGDSVEIDYLGTWYPGAVLAAKPGSYLIHYDGYDASWDEWVGPERLRGIKGRVAPAAQKPAARASGAESSAASGTVNSAAGAQAATAASPRSEAPVRYYDPFEITISLSGGSTVLIRSDGIIEKDGKEIGRLDYSKTYVSANGKELGYIDARFNIVVKGKTAGKFSEDYGIWRGGQLIARIEYGTVYLGTKEKGSAAMYDGSRADEETVALYFIFFDPEFGFVK